LPLHLFQLHRPVAFLLLATALGAVALSWTRVVQTIYDAKPVPVLGRATSVVWGDRVFGSRAELARWLRSRGVSYDAWSKKHPLASAVVEHRRVKRAARSAPARKAHPAPRPASARKAHAAPRPASARKAQPGPRTHLASGQAHKAAAEQPVAAAAAPSGDSLLRRVLVAMFVLLAAACAWAAALPTVLRHRFPSLAWSVGRYRELFLTGAVALLVGLVIGVAMN
jgi:hypothetical protein